MVENTYVKSTRGIISRFCRIRKIAQILVQFCFRSKVMAQFCFSGRWLCAGSPTIADGEREVVRSERLSETHATSLLLGKKN